MSLLVHSEFIDSRYEKKNNSWVIKSTYRQATFHTEIPGRRGVKNNGCTIFHSIFSWFTSSSILFPKNTHICWVLNIWRVTFTVPWRLRDARALGLPIIRTGNSVFLSNIYLSMSTIYSCSINSTHNVYSTTSFSLFSQQILCHVKKMPGDFGQLVTNHVAHWLEFWAFKDYLVVLPSLQTHTVSICGSHIYLSPMSISPLYLSKETWF